MAAAEADSYCAEADVIAVVQMGDYTTLTLPTQAQVLEFMAQRAAEIYTWMVAVAGTSAPGPVNYATSIDTGTDAGVALLALCKQTNSHGAASDALEAAGAGDRPARTERITELFNMFYAAKPQIVMLAAQYTGYSNSVSNHYSEGSVTSATLTSRTEATSFPFDTDTTW